MKRLSPIGIALLLFLFLIEAYSFTVFPDNWVNLDSGFLDFIIGNTLVIVFTLLAPMYAVVLLIISYGAGVLMPIGAAACFWSAIKKQTESPKKSLISGCLLSAATYFYIVKAGPWVLNFTIEVCRHVPKFFSWILSWII